MIRTIITAAAAASITLLGIGVASAATPEEIAAQCARATIPTALCNGSGGATTDIDGLGRAVQIDKGKYYSGNGKAVVIGYDETKPLKNEDGTLKVDSAGNQMYAPIMAPGEAQFSSYPKDEVGKFNGNGDYVVDLSGHQAK